MREVYDTRRAQLLAHDSTLEMPYLLDSPGVERSYTLPTPDQILVAILKAKEARLSAESYRGFSVGSCGMAFRKDGIQRLIRHGANFKNELGQSDIDIHAEELVLDKLHPDDSLSVLAVVGPPQEDNGSGILTPTLHPCDKCRSKLSQDTPTLNKTLIICARPDGTAVEWGSINDFNDLHDNQPNKVVSVEFEDTPSVFKPLPKQSHYDLADPSLDIDTSDWDQAVTYPLAEWIRESIRPE